MRLSGRTGQSRTAYERAVRLARDEVPYYRERFARAGGVPGEPLPVASSDLDRVRHQLFPLGAPWPGESAPPAWTPDPAALSAVLRLTGRHRPGSTVFELRPALLGTGRGRYRVLLSQDAVIDPFAPDPREEQARELAAAPAATLVGSPRDLAAFLAVADPGKATIIPVRPLADAATTVTGPALLHDPYLGHAGAWNASCGRPHLDSRRFHVTPVPAGLLVTKLGQRRPTLVDVLPEGTGGLTVTRCPDHGTPVLVPRPDAR